MCRNTPGSYRCECKAGYHGQVKDCKDLNECTSDKHKCSPHAHCTNAIGSYKCRCKKGFHGDGRNCKDKEECKENAVRMQHSWFSRAVMAAILHDINKRFLTWFFYVCHPTWPPGLCGSLGIGCKPSIGCTCLMRGNSHVLRNRLLGNVNTDLINYLNISVRTFLVSLNSPWGYKPISHAVITST